MIEFTIPGTAPSTPNLREHWAVKAKRVKAQKAAVARRMPQWDEGPLLVIRLTRVAPRTLDTDNLAAALKGHRDAVAARLRVDDATPLVRWEYAQKKGEPAVLVQMRRSAEDAIGGMGHAIHDQDPKWLKDRVAKSVDAAKEAEATFAAADDGHKPCAAPGCQMRVIGSDTCLSHDNGAWGLCGVAGCDRLPVRDGLCEEHQ